MIDLERELTEHLHRKAAAITPRFDLEAIEHRITPAEPTEFRGSRRLSMVAAAMLVAAGSVVVIIKQAGEDDSITTAVTDVTASLPVATPTLPHTAPTIAPTVSDVVPTTPSTVALGLRSSEDGQLTVSAPGHWNHALLSAPGVWGFTLGRELDNGDTVQVDFSDPVAYDLWCASLGGLPLLTSPADAATIAERLAQDPNLDTTAPVTVRVGGVEAISIDVELAAGGNVPCGNGFVPSPPPMDQTLLPDRVSGRWINELSVPGWKLRLYLVDTPDGMAVPTMAITICAPQDRFDEIIELTKPIIDSVRYNPD